MEYSMNLIELSEFKDYKGFTQTNDDTKLNVIISSVNSFVKQYCGRSFVDYISTSKVEFFKGDEVSAAFLTETPIIAVSEVAISSDCGVTYVPLTVAEDYYIDTEQDAVKTVDDLSFTLYKVNCSGISCRVTYTGGYVVLPEDLRLACLDLVEYYFEEQYTPRQNMSNTSVENIGSRITIQTNKLPPHIARILDQYRDFA